jgi:hypothetical protein
MSRENLEILLNEVLPLARQQLERTGRLVPFAAALDREEELEIHMPHGGGPADAEELADVLRAALRDGAEGDDYFATALCLDVRAQRASDSEPVDAICIELEAPGEALAAFLPYVRRDAGRPAFGEIFFGPLEPAVFLASEEG